MYELFTLMGFGRHDMYYMLMPRSRSAPESSIILVKPNAKFCRRVLFPPTRCKLIFLSSDGQPLAQPVTELSMNDWQCVTSLDEPAAGSLGSENSPNSLSAVEKVKRDPPHLTTIPS